ncbi:MAG: tetratricopeptide repeat protein [Chloroflexi bacterium]|nr:tetratricopeptide repeat protein [Chloroflexota bacterium]
MGDFIPVTRTKIIVPRRRAEILSRPRLLALIEELIDNRLMIVAAPAGYGKTSLLVDFAHSTQLPVCWYALDSLDQDPMRFIAHFISAMNQRFPSFGKSCLSALQNMGQDNLNLDALTSLIINDAYDNITEHFVLVIDDFHLVENSRPVVYFINRFLQDIDENCHVVIASRTLLTLPDLPLMVARSLVGGLSYEELAFQSEEIQSLLRQNFQISLTEDEAEALGRETEGWVTGLLLSSQVMGKKIASRQRVERVSGIGLYEYLAQQVLKQQPEDVQLFLLRSSLLDEFDAGWCEEVIGKALGIQADWYALMDAVLRSNSFVLPIGDEGQYLRYHHLFQDFLRERIQRERPGEARQIMMRLAQVYTERQEWERAYELYKELDEPGEVVSLVERAGSTMIVHGQLLTLSEWLDSLPAELMAKHPALISLRGTVAVTRGDTREGIRLLDQAVSGMRANGDQLQLATTLTRRSIAKLYAGQYLEADEDAEEALVFAAQDNGGNPYYGELYADALMCKGTVLSYLGSLDDSLDYLQKALAAYQKLNDANSAAKVRLEIGRVSRALGRYAEAEEAYLQALEYYQATNNLTWQANLYNSLGVLKHGRGDHIAATAAFEKAVEYAKISGSPRLEAYALASIGDLYQELDAVQETLEAYRQAREVARRIRDGYLEQYLSLMEARLFLSQGAVERAEERLEEARLKADELGLPSEQILCQLERGRAQLCRADFEAAYTNIKSALAYLVEEGHLVEIPRARLYALVAALSLGKLDDAERQAELLLPLLDDSDQKKRLTAFGREIKSQLQAQRNNAPAGKTRSFIDALSVCVDEGEQNIPNLRRMIRRHAAVVPFAPPKMTIRTLGLIQVTVSNHVITSSDWQVQVARDLFLLLLAHPEGLTKEQIGNIFWPDSTQSELKLRFKNTIYRLRHAAGKDVILFQGDDRYLFNREMDYEYDVEVFLKEIAQAEKADTAEKKEAHLLNAVAAYKGDYLPGLDDDWVVIERERLFQMYMDALLMLANSALDRKDYESSLAFCQKALQEDSCFEDAHRIAMRVFAAQGNRALLVRQYEQCRQALLEEVDAQPSYQTQMLYKTLIQ